MCPFIASLLPGPTLFFHSLLNLDHVPLFFPRAALRIKWDTNAIYFGGGLALYTMHVMSRLTAWKRSAGTGRVVTTADSR